MTLTAERAHHEDLCSLRPHHVGSKDRITVRINNQLHQSLAFVLGDSILQRPAGQMFHTHVRTSSRQGVRFGVNTKVQKRAQVLPNLTIPYLLANISADVFMSQVKATGGQELSCPSHR